jgi:hypothetical protein
MANEYKELVTDLRKEGAERNKKQIAKRMKCYGIFADSFIAEVVELDVKTVSKLKGARK